MPIASGANGNPVLLGLVRHISHGTATHEPQISFGPPTTIRATNAGHTVIRDGARHGGNTTCTQADAKLKVRDMLRLARTVTSTIQSLPGLIVTEVQRNDILTTLVNFNETLHSGLDLTNAFATIERNLVLNLSSCPMSDSDRSLLSKGVQFSLVGHTSYSASLKKAHQGVDEFLHTLAGKLAYANMVGYIATCHVDRTSTENSGTDRCNSKFRRWSHTLVKRSAFDNSYDQIEALRLAKKRLHAAVDRSHWLKVLNVTDAELRSYFKFRSAIQSGTVTIRKADKSRQFVILNTDDYTAGVRRLLDDQLNYRRVPFNGKFRAAALMKRVIQTFGQCVDQHTRNVLLTHVARPATRCFYALPKTHKPRDKWVGGIPPMRPICPDVKTESSASGKFIATHLQPYVESLPTFLKNSYDLDAELDNASGIPDSAIMLVADVEALYPSIPTGVAFSTIQALFDESSTTNMNRDLKIFIMELLRVQLESNYFDFNGDHFLQVRGVPMGKPWAPAVACLVMGVWDRKLCGNLQHKPLIFRRYIDDLFLVFESKEAAEQALQVMRSLDKNIVIGDAVISTAVNFLDVRISFQPPSSRNKDHRHFAYSVYRKDCDLRVFLHFDSCHSWRVKTNTLLSQLIRYWRLCSDKQFAATEIVTLLGCMHRFRHLPVRTARRVKQKLIRWVCRDLVLRNAPLAILPTFQQGLPRTVCRLPIEFNDYVIVNSLHCIFEQLSIHERRCVGRFVTDNHSTRALARLLF
jgi:hypothetical protein